MNEQNKHYLDDIAWLLNEKLWEPFKNEERIPIIREALAEAYDRGWADCMDNTLPDAPLP